MTKVGDRVGDRASLEGYIVELRPEEGTALVNWDNGVTSRISTRHLHPAAQEKETCIHGAAYGGICGHCAAAQEKEK